MRGISWLVALGLMAAAGAAAAQESRLGIRLAGDQPIQIESDKLEVREQENLAIFSGNVNVVQGPTLLKAGEMRVFYVKDGGGSGAGAVAGSQKIDRLEVSNKVYIKSNDQVATGDEGSFDVKTSIFTLTGKEVVLSQGDNVAKGCKLTVNTQTGKSQLDSRGPGCRVSVILMPGSQGN